MTSLPVKPGHTPAVGSAREWDFSRKTESVLNDGDAVIKIKSFDDTIPCQLHADQYVHLDEELVSKSDTNSLAVGVALFNEPPEKLDATLVSLLDSYAHMLEKQPQQQQDTLVPATADSSSKSSTSTLFVCVVQDGWSQAHPGTQKYLSQLFSNNLTQSIRNLRHQGRNTGTESGASQVVSAEISITSPLLDNAAGHDRDGTVICQKRLRTRDDGHQFDIFLCLVVKLRNRSKCNSLQWIFGMHGFVDAISCKLPQKLEYLLTLDTFSLVDVSCIHLLVSHMRSDARVDAVQARRRGMWNSEYVCGLESFLLHMMQMFDYEFESLVMDHFVSDFRRVVGACVLLRVQKLQSVHVRGKYFELLRGIQEEGTVPGAWDAIGRNVINTEDTLLTVMIAFNPDSSVGNVKCPTDAVYHFECENDLKSFVLQRRRWINGALANLAFILFFHVKSLIFDNVKFGPGLKSLGRKVRLWSVLALFLFAQDVLTKVFLPVMTLGLLHRMDRGRLKSVLGDSVYVKYVELINIGVVAVYAIVWLAFCAVHACSKFNLFVTRLALYVALLVPLYALCLNIIVHANDIVNTNFGLGVLCALGGVTLLQHVTVLVVDGPVRVLKFACYGLVAFVVGHFYQVFLASYAFTRASDLSWGNRPSDIVVKRKRQFCMPWAMLPVVLANAALYLVPNATTVAQYIGTYIIAVWIGIITVGCIKTMLVR